MDSMYCTHCGVEHPIPSVGKTNEWWCWQKNKNLKNGGSFVCQKWYKGYQLNYKRTKEGWARITYHTQRKSSKARKHPMPDYTLDEFKNWAFTQPAFDELYRNWVNSDYDITLRPSADRIDDYKPYSLLNLRLVTFKENHLNGVRSKKAHEAYKRVNDLQGLKLYQYSLSGMLIASYKSSYVASRATGIDNSSITKCCRGKQKTAGGFKWSRSIL